MDIWIHDNYIEFSTTPTTYSNKPNLIQIFDTTEGL
jgi:hypothetical protein